MTKHNTKRLRPDQVSRYVRRHNGAQFDNGSYSEWLTLKDGLAALNAKERAKFFNIARSKGANQ